MKVRRIETSDVDSELERLATAMELLTPDGGRVFFLAENHYRKLRDLFQAMHEEADNYPTYPSTSRSPYSVGTFCYDDDE